MNIILQMLLVAIFAGLAGLVVIFAIVKFGICDPINLDIGTRTIRFEAWPPFAKKPVPRAMRYYASGLTGHAASGGMIASAAATAFCFHVGITDPAVMELTTSPVAIVQDVTTTELKI